MGGHSESPKYNFNFLFYENNPEYKLDIEIDTTTKFRKELIHDIEVNEEESKLKNLISSQIKYIENEHSAIGYVETKKRSYVKILLVGNKFELNEEKQGKFLDEIINYISYNYGKN